MAIAHNNEEKPLSFIHLRNFVTASNGSPPNNINYVFQIFLNFCYRIYKNMFFGAFNFEVNVFYIYGKKYTQV